jgi:FtsH-binding integral membrane protein
MSVMESKVWERSGRDSIPRHLFYAILGAVLCEGFILTTFIARATAAWEPGFFMFLLVGLGIPILGILLSTSSTNPVLSLVGFNLVVTGIAAIMGPLLAMYVTTQPGLVERTAILTGLVTGVMTLTGLAFPKFYESIGRALFIALAGLVIVSFARIFIPAIQGVGIIDYIAAGIFSLYIGYDMWRASDVSATVDNAIDIAVSLYLDIINLFLTLLRINSDD